MITFSNRISLIFITLWLSYCQTFQNCYDAMAKDTILCESQFLKLDNKIPNVFTFAIQILSNP